MTENSELSRLFQAQLRLRHGDVAERMQAGIDLAKLAHQARHPVVHQRALELLGQQLGCHLIQSPERDAVIAVARAPAVASRLDRVASQ